MDTLVVTKRSQLTDIADAIRAKTGKSDEITLNDMPNEISEIGGGDKGFCYVDIESQLPNNVEVMVNIPASVSVEATGLDIEPLINISMDDGSNLGVGGSTYTATKNGGSFTDGKFVIDGSGYLTIPTPFMNNSNESWTIAFTIDAYTAGTSNYSRVARGNNDVPSIFYTKSVGKLQAKLAYGSANTSSVSVVNNSLISVLDSGACVFTVPTSAQNTFVFRKNDGYISLWINGREAMREDASRYSSDKYASMFSIGDNGGAGYNMSHMECSMLKIWDCALTDGEIACIN